MSAPREPAPAGPAAPAAPAAGGSSPASRRRRGLIVVLAVVLVAGAGYGAYYWFHGRFYVATDDAFIEGDIVPISSRVNAVVLSVAVQDNEEVGEGALLARLDARDWEARLSQTRANLEAARARHQAAATNVDLVKANTAAALDQAKAGTEQARALIEAAQAEVSSAEADVTAADAEAKRRRADFSRYESLDPRAVSRQQLDAARASSEAADANLAAARKRAASAVAKVLEARGRLAAAQGVLRAAETGPQQVAAAEAQARTAQAVVDQAAAEVAAAELQLSYTTIRAPVAGRVTRKLVQAGQYVDAGQVLLAIVRPEVWVVANFKETQLTHIRAGQSATVRVDAYGARPFRAKVDSIQAGTGARFSLLPPENATGNYVKVVQRVPVKIVFDSDEQGRLLLAPGMSVVPSVRITLGPDDHPSPIGPPAATAGSSR